MLDNPKLHAEEFLNTWSLLYVSHSEYHVFTSYLSVIEYAAVRTLEGDVIFIRYTGIRYSHHIPCKRMEKPRYKRKERVAAKTQSCIYAEIL